MAAVQQALALAQSINNPKDASKIQQFSQELQSIQLSQDGWAIADAMLSENDSNLKFIGALTFQIKLNKEG